jgi:hypothetical protein
MDIAAAIADNAIPRSSVSFETTSMENYSDGIHSGDRVQVVQLLFIITCGDCKPLDFPLYTCDWHGFMAEQPCSGNSRIPP